MFWRIREWWRLRYLFRLERRLREDAVFGQESHDQQAEDLEAVHAAIANHGELYSRVRDEIDWIKSERILRDADKYDVPTAPRIFMSNNLITEPWRRSDVTPNLVVLTQSGRAELRNAIREEKRERRESWLWPVSIVFGLIGALTGLASILGH